MEPEHARAATRGTSGSTRSPILAALINQLYPGVVNAPEQNRDDLVSVLLTGVPNLNFTGQTQADMLRLNLSIAPTRPSERATASASSATTSRASRTGGASRTT